MLRYVFVIFSILVLNVSTEVYSQDIINYDSVDIHCYNLSGVCIDSENMPINGVVTDSYMDSMIDPSNQTEIVLRQFTYADGVLNGSYYEYYPNANNSIWIESNFQTGLLDGEKKIYYNDGTLENSAIFVDGIQEGITRSYYPNGNIVRENNFKNDALDGISKTYLDDGTIYSETIFDNGIKNGYERYFYPNGKLYAEFQYTNDVISSGTCYYEESSEEAIIDAGLQVYVTRNIIPCGLPDEVDISLFMVPDDTAMETSTVEEISTEDSLEEEIILDDSPDAAVPIEDSLYE